MDERRTAQGGRLLADLVRRPASGWEWLADGVRVLGAASVVVGGVGWGFSAAAVLLLAASAALLPRVLGLRGGIDAGFGAVVLLAAWSGVTELYQRIPWWDVAVHVVCTGLIVVVGIVVLSRAGIVAHPSSAPTFATAAVGATLGLALGALWEIVEWLGHNVVDSAIFVEYDDTIGDMAAGGAGALLAGILVAKARLERPRADADPAR
ncbi:MULTISPECIES: hypothetical protein [unclassified Agrococcus]|uniref:hypothetical protein n=1 Tax=unclassified Agrococcus TaxID=2615065 RepID=UPI00361313F6